MTKVSWWNSTGLLLQSLNFPCKEYSFFYANIVFVYWFMLRVLNILIINWTRGCYTDRHSLGAGSHSLFIDIKYWLMQSNSIYFKEAATLTEYIKHGRLGQKILHQQKNSMSTFEVKAWNTLLNIIKSGQLVSQQRSKEAIGRSQKLQQPWIWNKLSKQKLRLHTSWEFPAGGSFSKSSVVKLRTEGVKPFRRAACEDKPNSENCTRHLLLRLLSATIFRWSHFSSTSLTSIPASYPSRFHLTSSFSSNCSK